MADPSTPRAHGACPILLRGPGGAAGCVPYEYPAELEYLVTGGSRLVEPEEGPLVHWRVILKGVSIPEP